MCFDLVLRKLNLGLQYLIFYKHKIFKISFSDFSIFIISLLFETPSELGLYFTSQKLFNPCSVIIMEIELSFQEYSSTQLILTEGSFIFHY